MKYGSFNICNRSTAQLIVVFAILSALLGSGCSVPVPKLTAEDRQRDIQFMADWARDYSPLVELNEKHKGTPSYEALLPQYTELAAQAQSDDEFCLIVLQYFKVIGASGHAFQLPDDYLKWGSVGSLLGVINLGITPGQFQQARYWRELAGNLSLYAHPPFRIINREDRYFTDDDWQYEGTAVPKGSEILKVNGMTCSDYLDFLKTDTWLKYSAYKDSVASNHLLIVDEGPSFHGWSVVDFGLPDGNTLQASVPILKGWPTPKEQRVHTKEPNANRTCLELTEDVGYIRIKSFIGHPADVLLKRNIKMERKQIRAFLERSRGKYAKLIIDVRDNDGGDPSYWYENLVRPFLDQPVTYRHTAGLKRQFLKDTKPSVLRQSRKFLAQEYVVDTKDVAPPEGFDSDEWVFYEITRRLEPSQRFPFKGDMYVLINGGCYSACDDYAQTVKRIGMATLVGQTTGGYGGIGYCMNSLVRLPKSGMIFALDVHLPLNPDGSFTALHGLEPDIELPDADPPKSITKEDLLEDEWIKWILADAQDCTDRD